MVCVRGCSGFTDFDIGKFQTNQLTLNRKPNKLGRNVGLHVEALPLGILLMKSCALAFAARSSILGGKPRHTHNAQSLQDPDLRNLQLFFEGGLDMI